jgi:hypothetical protein
MAQETIRFEFKSLNIIDEYFEKELIKSHKEQLPKASHHVRIETKLLPDQDIVIIIVTLTIKVNSSNVELARLQIENTFHVYNLKKHISIHENEVLLNNHRFASYLIDNSIAHLRAVQAVKMKDYFDEVPFIPFLNASNLFSKQKREGTNKEAAS